MKKVNKGKKKKSEYLEEKKTFGKIPLLSNLKANGKEIYLHCKDREEVEAVFDSMKNQLETDKTYLQSDEAVYGYFFVIFNFLFLYYKILSMLKEHDLNDKYSVKDVLLLLSKIHIVDFGHKRILSEIPKKVEDLVENLGIEKEMYSL